MRQGVTDDSTPSTNRDVSRLQSVPESEEVIPKTCKSNESQRVAFLSSEPSVHIGQQIAKRRMELKKTRKQMGVSVKTLWGWETNRHQPGALLRQLKRSI